MPYFKDFELRTDTASIAIFDDDVIAHRLEERSDWWSLPSARVKEINNGAMMLASLGSDGIYTVHIQIDTALAPPALRARILSRSGRIRIGAGESLPGEGLPPKDGVRIDCEPGTYEVSLQRIGDWEIAVSVIEVEGEAQNNIERPLRIDTPNDAGE